MAQNARPREFKINRIFNLWTKIYTVDTVFKTKKLLFTLCGAQYFHKYS